MTNLSQHTDLLAFAKKVFENDKAFSIEWLKSPQRALGGKIPIEYADTESGKETVKNILGAIDHGVFL